LAQCQPCIADAIANSTALQELAPSTTIDNPAQYDCTLPGLEGFTPGRYAGIKVNYLSFATETSSPNMPVRAAELEACTGGRIAFAEAENVWEDPLADLGSGETKGFELYDGYFMSYSHFPEASALGLAETLNERIRESNERLQWEDVLPKVRHMGEYRKDGQTNIDFLMYDGDFFVPIVRLDLLEKYEKPLPNTWEEVVELATFFHGKDLNDDGNADDYGFCHFPRLGAGYWDWWWSEAMYATWATFDQTEGIGEGFFFDAETMDPRTSGPGFKKAAEIWKTLWQNGADGCGDNFISGKCAIGFSPPGCWKGVFLDPNGVHRKDANGTVVWQPRLKSGEVVEPYRFRPFGSTTYFDRNTGEEKQCTEDECPKAEPIPMRGHDDLIEASSASYAARAKVLESILPPSPLAGKLINRAPFYWSGGLGTMIRKSAQEIKKDFVWDFFVYTNSPATSKYDVANYASWLDSWRFSQLFPGDNFLSGGWSEDSYQEHAAVMKWALSTESNGALNLRIPALAKYTRDTVGELMGKYIANNITLDQLSTQVSNGWTKITADMGKLNQLEIYRAALGLDPLSTVEKCRLHRKEMDYIDPTTCKEADDSTTLIIIILSSIVGGGIVILVVYFSYKRYKAYQAIKKAHAQLMESTLNEATRALRELDYPLHLVRGDEFIEEGKLMRHEVMRNTHRLTVLDNLLDVDPFIQAGKHIVFFSHQWTAFDLPDPSNQQYGTMVNAMKELAKRNGWDPSLRDVFVWVDYSCIPQANASVQNLAIRSLAVYASSATYFVIIAPSTKHADLDNICDLDTYQRRMWCRAEQVCHSMRNGTTGMYLATSSESKSGQLGDLKFMPVKSDFFLESLHVFNGELTCCRFEHKGMESCDRQSLVVPILGLYGELLRAAHDGIKGNNADMSMVTAFLKEIEKHQETVFPRNFQRVMWRKNKRVVEEVLLFGDLIDRMRQRIEKGTMFVIQERGGTESTKSTQGFVRHGASDFVRHGGMAEGGEDGGTKPIMNEGSIVSESGNANLDKGSSFVRHGSIAESGEENDQGAGDGSPEGGGANHDVFINVLDSKTE